MYRDAHCFWATVMWCMAILLPTPRDPECRNNHTRSSSSRLTSMKWLPEPSVPSCRDQFAAYRAGSNSRDCACSFRCAIRSMV